MPFYRLKTGIVHMRGTKLPDPCGARMLIESREQACLAPSAFLCDGRSDSRSSGTCDRALCEAHAREVGRNRHLCPACAAEHRDANRQRGLFTSLV